MNGSDVLENKRKFLVTELNDYDRKILDKYTRFYTNFLESNTAQTDVLESERFDPKS